MSKKLKYDISVDVIRAAVKSSLSYKATYLKLGAIKSNSYMRKMVAKKISEYSIDTSHFVKTQSKETRALISEKRKAFLKANPEKHPWKYHKYNKSKPCEIFKQKLREANIPFEEENSNLVANRFFSADIILKQYNLIIEINGNQHYNSDGETLTPYFLERKIQFEKLGWKILDVKYFLVFNANKLNELINQLKNMPVEELTAKFTEPQRICKICNNHFNIRSATQKYCNGCKPKIENYLKQNNERNFICLTCRSNFKSKESRPPKYCSYDCSHAGARKTERPTRDQLEKLIWEKPTIQIAKEYNVSDKAVEKWCKSYNISKPPRGHWAKIKSLIKD